MDTFQWMKHLFETQYPDSSTRIQFGKGYTFAAPPTAPDQRVFRLYFKGFKYYVNTDGTLDITTNQYDDNLGALETFYQTHRLSQNFLYIHPAWGSVTVKFFKPLQVPKGIASGNGMVEDFTIDLMEQP